MTTSVTTIPTAFASRYLQQLCKHWSHKFPVEFTPEQGEIPFGPDRVCRLYAGPDALRLSLEMQNAEDLPRMQKVVIDHLERFAHRETLPQAVWTQN